MELFAFQLGAPLAAPKRVEDFRWRRFSSQYVGRCAGADPGTRSSAISAMSRENQILLDLVVGCAGSAATGFT